ncbi:MAG TPA: AMP-dependent synthetase/ligase [Solirubrobacteraceae bacterium]|nr:AMP-dependent synthetase/ligase [Solirubrobacteraceae bacterium]
MEAAAAPSTTGSQTIADLIARSAVEHADHAAVRYKRDGQWHDVSYTQLADIVQEIALGLIELAIEPGERLCILANTRPDWSYVDMAATSAGLVVVPIYQTNSPEECHWVISDSDACAIVVENDEQLAKIDAIRDRLPNLRTVIIIDPPAAGEASAAAAAPAASSADAIAANGANAANGAPAANGSSAAGDSPAPAPALQPITLDELRDRGRRRSPEELDARRALVQPDDPFTFIYTSGTTGPPKGCVLTHGNYRAIIDMVSEAGEISSDEVVYLYLPLAHSFALLIQLAVFDLGGTLAYFGGDTKQIVGELLEVKPTYLPSVPRVFEKIYTLARAAIDAQPPEERERADAAIALGVKVRDLLNRGEDVPAELKQPFEEADEQLFKNVRAIFGGRVRHATSGAAPIAKEILEFFWACGVPVLEGYGMTETATAATVSTVENHRFGTVGRALPGVELKIAADGEILVKGPNIFHGYHNQASTSFGAVENGWLHTGDLGSLDEDGYLSITGRKKDIIITAGGKNLTPANIENDLKQSRWISQAVMYGDQRPYPVVLVTLDEEEMPAYAREHGLPQDIASLAREPAVRELIQHEIDRANAKYAQVEQVKKFVILDHDLSQATGELTPTLKVKRNVVNDRYAHLFDALYAG